MRQVPARVDRALHADGNGTGRQVVEGDPVPDVRSWCEGYFHFDGEEMTPLAIDLFCGLGGWTDGLLAEDYFVVGK